MQHQEHSYNARLLIPITNTDGCKDFNWGDFKKGSFKEGKKFMVLVNSGKCTFSQKIKSAEVIGASVVIVANYQEGTDSKIEKNTDKS